MTALLCLLAGQLTHAFPFEERALDHVRTLHGLTAPGVALPSLKLKDRRFRLSYNPGAEPGLATLIFERGSASFWPDNGRIESIRLPKQGGPTVAQGEIERRAKLVLDHLVESGESQELAAGRFDHIAETYATSTVVIRKGYPLTQCRVVLDSRTGQLIELKAGRRFFDFTQPVTPKIDADEAFLIAARTYLKHKPYGLTSYRTTNRPSWSKVSALPARDGRKPDQATVDWHAPVPPDRVGRTTLRSNFLFGWQFCTVDWVTGTATSLSGMDFDQGQTQRRVESEVDIEGRTWRLFESDALGTFEEAPPPKPGDPRLGRRVLLFSDAYAMSGMYDLDSGRFVVELARGRIYLRPDRGLRRALERTRDRSAKHVDDAQLVQALDQFDQHANLRPVDHSARLSAVGRLH